MSETQQKTALITGANKGIGFEVARQLGNAGYTVLIGVRNLVAGQQAVVTLKSEQIDARVLELDLDNVASITAAASTVAANHSHLDILVNNAGIADRADGLPSITTLESVERTMRTNFFGALAVTQAMLPLLRTAPSARIVNVSSGLGSLTHIGDPTWPYAAAKFLGYSASKAALNMLTVQLAWELRDTPIKVNSADPGYTATDLNQNQGHQTIPEGAAETIRLALLPDSGPTGTFSNNEGIEPW